MTREIRITITDETYRRLDEISTKAAVSVSAYVKLLLFNHVNPDGITTEPAIEEDDDPFAGSMPHDDDDDD